MHFCTILWHEIEVEESRTSSFSTNFLDLLVTIYKNSLSPLSKSCKIWVCCYSKINIYLGRKKLRRLSGSLCPSKPPCSETVKPRGKQNQTTLFRDHQASQVTKPNHPVQRQSSLAGNKPPCSETKPRRKPSQSVQRPIVPDCRISGSLCSNQNLTNHLRKQPIA